MRRVFLALCGLCLSNIVFAQTQTSGDLTITNERLDWKFPNQIVCSENKDSVYIAFGGDEMIILKPAVVDLNRNKLSLLLTADKPIFYQQSSEGDNAYRYAGMLVTDNGEKIGIAKIIIKKKELPITLTFNGKKISIVEFDSTENSQCEIVRKRASAYQKLPDCKVDTVEIDKLGNIKCPVIVLKPSDAWKVSAKYFVNGKECSIQNGTILMKPELCPDIKTGDVIDISYSIKCEHDFFGHTRKGHLAEIYIDKKDNPFGGTWWSWSYLWYLLSIPIIIGGVRYGRVKLVSKKKNKLNKIQQEYLERIVNNKGSEDKLSIVKKLLSNEDIEFKTNIAGMLNIETSPRIDELKREIENQKNEINVLSRQVATLKEDVITLENEKTSFENEKTLICSRLNNLTFENKALAKKNSELEQTVNQLHLDVNGLKLIIANKDKQIELFLQRNKTLKDQLVRISRQNMYLLQIDDALKEASDEILNAFSEVEDGDLKKKLVLPLLNGVAGLDDGITTYYNRWQKQVMAVQNDFFGKDLYEMSDDEVKYKLVSGFLKNLAQGDTFSKLTRLYMYIQADWINEILIKNKFNVDKVEQIFNRLKILFNEFGIEIIYPRLFVDHMDEQQYTFDPRCEVFKLFPISEDMRILYSKQTDLIIDIVQIGVKIPAEQYSRKAIVSIPNF